MMKNEQQLEVQMEPDVIRSNARVRRKLRASIFSSVKALGVVVR